MVRREIRGQTRAACRSLTIAQLRRCRHENITEAVRINAGRRRTAIEIVRSTGLT